MITLVLAVTKIIDSFVVTQKSIAVYKNKPILASFWNMIGMFLMSTIFVKLSQLNSYSSIALVSLASGIGVYTSIKFANKSKKNQIWAYYVRTQTRKQSKKLADALRKNGIEVQTVEAYNNNLERILKIMAISKNADQSKIIDSFMKPQYEILRMPVVDFKVYENEVR